MPEVSSGNPYKTGPFSKNQRLKASDLETLRDGTRGNVQMRNLDNFVKRFPNGHSITSKKRSKKGGAQRPWIEITAVTDKDNYIGKVLTSPDDSTELATGVTIKSVPSSEGLLKVGDTFFADLIGSTYYISPSIFYGS